MSRKTLSSNSTQYRVRSDFESRALVALLFGIFVAAMLVLAWLGGHL